jgi:hypothetical protein
MALTYTKGPEWAQTVQDLERLKHSVDNMRPTLVKARDAYYNEVKDVFRTEGQSAGLVWRALSQMRVNERMMLIVMGAAQGGGSGPGVGSNHPILEWTGELKDAATTGKSQPSVGTYESIGNRSLKISLYGEKAVLMAEGGTNEVGLQVPARNYWPWYDQQADVMEKPFQEVFDDWLASL